MTEAPNDPRNGDFPVPHHLPNTLDAARHQLDEGTCEKQLRHIL